LAAAVNGANSGSEVHPIHLFALQVGDKVEVHYRNGCSFPNSLHAHGVFYTKGHEGSILAESSSEKAMKDDSIAPGGSYMYKWDVPERAGPALRERSSAFWMYHSHTDEVADVNAGLAGPIVITAQGMAKEDGSPNDVDQELFLHWDVVVEELSALVDKNFVGGLAEVATKAAAKKLPSDANAEGSEDKVEPEEDLGVMHMINGYLYGNMPEPELKLGSRVRWYNVALGTEPHTPHWHGNNGIWAGRRADVLHVLPADFEILDMVPDATGRWLVHCHVDDHILAGMTAAYKVVA
jgi:manganese oxidase